MIVICATETRKTRAFLCEKTSRVKKRKIIHTRAQNGRKVNESTFFIYITRERDERPYDLHSAVAVDDDVAVLHPLVSYSFSTLWRWLR